MVVALGEIEIQVNTEPATNQLLHPVKNVLRLLKDFTAGEEQNDISIEDQKIMIKAQFSGEQNLLQTGLLSFQLEGCNNRI